MNRYLTSADRSVIARITDLAIDVTAQGRYIADATYSGALNELTLSVKRRRAPSDTETIASTFSHCVTLPQGPQDPTLDRERNTTLAQMALFLESLLEKPEPEDPPSW